MKGTEKQKVAIIHLAIHLDTQITHYVVAMEKVAEFEKFCCNFNFY